MKVIADLFLQLSAQEVISFKQVKYTFKIGSYSLSATELISFQANGYKSYNAILKYSMTTYDLSVGVKGVDWEFDNNQSVTLGCYGQGISGSSTNFIVGMYATNA